MKKKRLKKYIKKILLPISLFINAISIVANIYAIPEYYITKEALQREIKENRTKVQATYLMCSLVDIDVAYDNNHNYHIVKNDINDICNPIYKYAEYNNSKIVNQALGINIEGNIYDYQVVFLLIESFGSHDLEKMSIETTVLKYDENIIYDSTNRPRFAGLPKANLEEKVTFELETRSAGEKILIPLLVEYKVSDEDTTNFWQQYIYKEVYRPDIIKFVDGVTGEKKEIKVRDVLNDSIEMDLYFVGFG